MSYIKRSYMEKLLSPKKSVKTRYLYIKFVYKCYNLHHFYKYKSGITFFVLLLSTQMNFYDDENLIYNHFF